MKKYIYNDFDSLFEKFSILTVDGKMSDKKAFEFLKDKTSPELINKLEDKIAEIELG